MKIKAITTIPSTWRRFSNWRILAALLPILFMTGLVQAQFVTNIIYQDNFARTGQLDGTAPDTVNTPGATWFACNIPAKNAQLQTDGASLALTNTPGTTNGIYLNGFLPFTPQVGHVYRVSANISSLSGSNQWLAMGFATHALTNNFFATYQCGSGWVLVRGNGTNFSTFGALTSSSSFGTAFGTSTNLFAVTLDTTAGNANYGWTIKFYTNGVLVTGGNYTIPYGNYPIKYVGIGADAGQGYFQNFTLTDVLERQGVPTITEPPQNTTAQAGQTATFWAGVTNDYPAAAYQWMTNGATGPTNAIAGATNAAYTTPTLDMTYNGLNYSVTITNANGSTNSATAALTVVSAPPTVYSVTKTKSVTNIVVAFSKAVDPGTGLNAANYSLTINGAPSGVSILSASYGSSSNNVILMTSTLNTNAGYYLNVQNVQDSFGNATIASTNVVLPAGLVFYVRADSGVVYDSSGSLVAQWLDQTTNGNNASQFFGVPTAGPLYLGSVVRPTTSLFNNGQQALDFGTTLHWLAAPSTPSLASMTTNTTMYAVARFTAASDELVNKNWGNLPAPFDWDPSPQAENIQYGNGGNNAPASGTGSTVLLNTPYVLSSMLSFPPLNGLATNTFNFWLNGAPNGNGNLRPLTDNPPALWDAGFPLWVGGRWDLVNPRMRGQIAGIMLFDTALSGADRTNVDNFLGQKYFTFTIAQDLPASTTSSNGFAVTYTFLASQGSVHGFSFQWQENGTNIPGANGSTYTTPILSPSDNGDTFDVLVTSPNGSTINSVTNTLTVLNVAPTVSWAGIPVWNTTNQIVVLFDQAAMDPASATAITNYSLNNGASVLSAAIGGAPNQVVLTTTPISWNANPGYYTLTVSNVMDVYNNVMAPASLPLGLYPPNVVLWLKANTGVVTDSGTNTVNEWDDQSGNGNTFVQQSGLAFEPQQVTNTWGDVVLRFTNTPAVASNYLENVNVSGTLAITGDMSIYAAVNFQPQTGRNGSLLSKNGQLSGTKNLAAPYDIYMGISGTLFYRGNGSTYGQTTATLGPGAGYPCVVAVSETGNTVSQYFNNQAAGTGPLSGGYQESSDADGGNLTFIGYRADAFNSLTGDLAEMIVTSSGSSSSDVAALDIYLSTQHHFVLFNPNRTNIVVAVKNSQMTLSWPVDHTGWQLQSNSVGLTATSAWYTVSGSTLTNQITITPSAESSNVFYRMFFQQP